MSKKERGKVGGEFIPDEPGVIGHRWLPKPSGLGPIRWPGRLEVALLLGVAVVVYVAVRAASAEPKPETQAYSYEAASKGTSSPFGTYMLWGFAGLLGLVVVVGFGSLILRWVVGAWESWQMAKIRVDAARVLPKAENGHLYVPKRGGVADVEASPSRRTTRDGRQPEPESLAHSDAVYNLTMMETLRATGGRATIEKDAPPQEPPFIEGQKGEAWNRQLYGRGEGS